MDPLAWGKMLKLTKIHWNNSRGIFQVFNVTLFCVFSPEMLVSFLCLFLFPCFAFGCYILHLFILYFFKLIIVVIVNFTTCVLTLLLAL